MRRARSFQRLRRLAAAVALAATVAPAPAQAQAPRREVRALWLATVGGLDWPKTTDAAAQRAELVRQISEARASGINTLIFQVRPESDAYYRSSIEPFARSLTGTQGGDPGYDPLAFALAEAHKRGMELHAWFNPYRVQASSGSYTTAATHVSKTHPEWVLAFPQTSGATLAMLDPGRQAVRNYVATVIADVVRRYDIDGVHFDDYFYPYSGITTQDDATFAAEKRGFTFRSDWRRDNVNIFIRQVRDSIAVIRPSVRFGISPFGIWRSGTPAGTSGLDAYSVLYADAPEWMAQGLLDYLTPQLYWTFGGGQDYAKLMPWWQTVLYGRHLYPGLITNTGSGTTIPIPRQIRFNRDNGVFGHVLFRSLTVIGNTGGVNDSLRQKLFTRPALPPVMPWKGDTTPPGAPTWAGQSGTPGNLTIAWSPAEPAADGDRARWFAIQRVPAGGSLDLATGTQIVGVVRASLGSTWTYTGPASPGDRFVVLAYDDNWNESAASPASFPVSGDGLATDAPLGLSAAPSPARDVVTLRYRLPASASPTRATLDVYDTLGRRVARLALGGGTGGEVVWPVADVPPGVYVARLSADGAAASQRVVIAR